MGKARITRIIFSALVLCAAACGGADSVVPESYGVFAVSGGELVELRLHIVELALQ